MRRFILLLLFMNGTIALAGPFSLSNRTFGTTNATVINQLNTLFNLLETEVNTKLPDTENTDYMRSAANSAVLALSGTSVDYVNNADYFILGASVGLAADIGNNSTLALIRGEVDAYEFKGASVTQAIMLGTNIDTLKDESEMKGNERDEQVYLFVNFSRRSLDDLYDEVTGNIDNIGFHVRYRLIDEQKLLFNSNLLKWGGASLTMGVDYSGLEINYQNTVNRTSTQTVSGATATATFAGVTTVGADITVFSFPLEVSTYFTTLYAFSFYFGAGANISFGSAESEATVTGNLSVTGAGVPSGATAVANLDLGADDNPSLLLTKFFYGVQFNIPYLKIYTQVNNIILRNIWGFNAGVRVVW